MDLRPILELTGCSKRYGEKDVLYNISLAVGAGEFLSILGSTGSGKTTLLRIIAGLEKMNTGTLNIDGHTASRDSKIVTPPHRRGIGFIFQDLALWPHFTVFENIAFGLKAKKEDNIKEKAMSVLKKLALDNLSKHYPNQLSGGQQQLTALARNLVLNPKMLLMDEPMANLDVKLKEKLKKIVKDIARERNLTVIYVTHDHREAFELSDGIAVLNNGTFEFKGTPDELRNSENQLIKEFIEI